MSPAAVCYANESFVTTEDNLALAVKDAKVRAFAVYGNGRKTLVDMIPLADFAAWDASDEKALVGAKNMADADDDELAEADFAE